MCPSVQTQMLTSEKKDWNGQLRCPIFLKKQKQGLHTSHYVLAVDQNAQNIGG
jgi:hypothetical protein